MSLSLCQMQFCFEADDEFDFIRFNLSGALEGFFLMPRADSSWCRSRGQKSELCAAIFPTNSATWEAVSVSEERELMNHETVTSLMTFNTKKTFLFCYSLICHRIWMLFWPSSDRNCWNVWHFKAFCDFLSPSEGSMTKQIATSSTTDFRMTKKLFSSSLGQKHKTFVPL